jgi:hypothetical protein
LAQSLEPFESDAIYSLGLERGFQVVWKEDPNLLKPAAWDKNQEILELEVLEGLLKGLSDRVLIGTVFLPQRLVNLGDLEDLAAGSILRKIDYILVRDWSRVMPAMKLENMEILLKGVRLISIQA